MLSRSANSPRVRVRPGVFDENMAEPGKAEAQELGRKGGRARAERMTPERRVEIARNAAAKRWGRTKETQPKATPPRKAAAAPGETPPDLYRTWFLSLNDRG